LVFANCKLAHGGKNKFNFIQNCIEDSEFDFTTGYRVCRDFVRARADAAEELSVNTYTVKSIRNSSTRVEIVAETTAIVFPPALAAARHAPAVDPLDLINAAQDEVVAQFPDLVPVALAAAASYDDASESASEVARIQII
jgi:hypothetical protein